MVTRFGRVSQRFGANPRPLDEQHEFAQLSLQESHSQKLTPAEQNYCDALDKHTSHDDAVLMEMGCLLLARRKLDDETLISAAVKGHAMDSALVSAGIGGGFKDTTELNPMNCKEAVKKDPIVWGKAFKEEHARMIKHNVWQAVLRRILRLQLN